MTNAERILDHLQTINGAVCDDCLSETLNIRPRQQVNQRVRSLYRGGKIERQEANCSRCDRTKLVNIKR